ncbi:MAG: hypothetical protein RMY36_030820 [Nostoc sp. SerVER01]|nr:hypothetical protein [Nostoc sp. SerVER01]
MTEAKPLFDVEALAVQNRRKQAQKKLPPATQKLLLMMTEMELAKEVTAALLDLADMELGHIRYIAGPVITHRSAWMDCIPPWIFKAIAIDRLKLVFEEHQKGIVGSLATPAEVVAVMMPASYEAPMGSRWTDVYLWACNEAIMSHNRLRDGVKDAWEIIGGRPVDYKSIKHDYEELARDIRAKVVEQARQRGWVSKRTRSLEEKQVKRSTKASEIEGQLNILESPIVEPSEDETVAAPPSGGVVQTNLFDFLG